MTLNTAKKKLKKDLKTVGKNLKKGLSKTEKEAAKLKKGAKKTSRQDQIQILNLFRVLVEVAKFFSKFFLPIISTTPKDSRMLMGTEPLIIFDISTNKIYYER